MRKSETGNGLHTWDAWLSKNMHLQIQQFTIQQAVYNHINLKDNALHRSRTSEWWKDHRVTIHKHGTSALPLACDFHTSMDHNMDVSDTVTPERLTFIARVEVEKEGVQSPSTIKNEFVFIKKSMSKDGDCFYHCIIEGTPGSNWDYKKLRDRVANVLKGRAADFVPDNYTGTVTTQALT